MKACYDVACEENLSFVTEFYGDEFNVQQLESQLTTFKTLYSEKTSEQPSITSMRNVLQSLSCAQRSMVDMICQGFRILLVMPVLLKVFSALRRIKSYLRNSMTQARLNHVLFLHCHQDQTNSLDLKNRKFLYIIQ